MKAIVYESNTGFTKEYAELLAKETNLPMYDRIEAKKYLENNDEIIYLGWILAGNIKGYKKASKIYNVKILCGVGMGSPSQKQTEEIEDRYKLDGNNVFYLQGGFNLDRLHGIYKLMMSSMSKTVGKMLEKKENKTEEETAMLNVMKNGGDFVKLENLNPILSLVK